MSSPTALGSSNFSPSPPNGERYAGVNSLSRSDRKEDVDPALRKAAEGMEAEFLKYMMKVMRQTIPKNEMNLESPATGIYRSMLDNETAERASRVGGVGLADQIIAYYQAKRYTFPQGQGAPLTEDPLKNTGGIHAGEPIRK